MPPIKEDVSLVAIVERGAFMGRHSQKSDRGGALSSDSTGSPAVDESWSRATESEPASLQPASAAATGVEPADVEPAGVEPASGESTGGLAAFFGDDETLYSEDVASADFPETVAMHAPTRQRSTRKKRSLFWCALGVLGELLITVGIVVGLFVVWQLWWTDVVAKQEQAAAIEEIQDDWGEAPVKIGTPRYDDPPAVPHPTDEGALIGLMRIPRFGVDNVDTIREGVGLKTVLDTGAFGHYPDTAYPGEIGNFATAAHRQTYGAPMRDVDQLQVDDAIIVETEDAYLIYKVTDSYIVEPSQGEVVAPVPGDLEAEATERHLTITTCHPPFVSDKRWVIHAKYDHWVARDDGIPEELAK
ncbi:class E sortase [Actinobaculum sp. 313]|uniref:class E sortase n=1 Tax=Actinobaculum sp. 313 TaxID=2495645 RepID=UPI001F0C354D|nr:class E sortase [Actinobaculum sp. 313]